MQQKVEEVFAKEFAHFLKQSNIKQDASCLVVGLGNWNVTPDALGPQVCENILVTRHLYQLQPENVEEGFRSVSALSPGVMGLLELRQVILFLVLLKKQNQILLL